MTAYISIHNAHQISADAGETSGAPVGIRAKTRAGSIFEITLYTDDFALSRKLSAAINATVREHEQSKQEAA